MCKCNSMLSASEGPCRWSWEGVRVSQMCPLKIPTAQLLTHHQTNCRCWAEDILCPLLLASRRAAFALDLSAALVSAAT